MSLTVTNINNSSFFLGDPTIRTETFTSAAAGVIAQGTILARDSVSGKLVLFTKGGTTNENGIPKAVVITAFSPTGAGDTSIRVAVEGKFREDRLVIDADGDNSNIDQAVKDQLRGYNLITVGVTELNTQDNQ